MALQMAWQPNLLHQKRKTGPPLGLKNLGNSCYLNSVLQCLTYTPPLANFCLKNQHSSSCDSASGSEKKRDCPFCILERRIARSLSVDLTLDAPSKLNSCLRSFAEHFRLGRQEDAHEFLRYVIDACHNSCLRIKKLQQQRRKIVSDEEIGAASTVFKEIFGGALQSQVKCLSCGSESNKVDEIMDISLDVLHSSSVKESLQKFFQAEVLDGNNKYNCENCKKLVAARKQMKLLQAPNVLVIQLKRFEGIFGGKIDKAIDFEEILLLSSYMCNGSQDPYPEYRLFATVVHSGFSPDSGHYYAYVKDPMGRWYCCNDSYVTVSTLPEVLSEKVYMLFFTRTKQRPAATNGDAHCSNGIKHQVCSGSETSKGHNVASNKTVPKKQSVVSHSSENESPNISMANRATDKLENGNSRDNFGKTMSNGKVTFQINKVHSNGNNGTAKASISQEKAVKIAPLQNGNGVKKIKVVEENGGSLPLPNGNSSTKEPPKQAEATVHVGNGFQNGVRSPSPMSGSKRKTQDSDSHVLLAKDDQPQTELEALKEGLVKHASGALQFCGWTNEVYNFMRSRKKLCLEECGGVAPKQNELKTILIQEGKRKFISQIPESLKENLIQRLIKSFDHRDGRTN
ncbi:ubiquitin carboxyl-terminal hydrolase 25 [Impatiens glandulifera]|uniref:ubiquitin carboxyl-terminal hydrolase 25 n=1 Tax=Impatiens glandulifera TaxID=253017 RepID=UPI001FB10B89|nr:ubiquitin carboxyl-terminal hydrolase 25 [Impatiens glandulifera]XP_047310660.1 ubiquitin carboxyl-terminal hydrolase 25 [Impatiens glandulifera]XP_047310661.1 ubiquitin carboxyl-terminal hydrolase 25 [Impatiens glandulifera]